MKRRRFLTIAGRATVGGVLLPGWGGGDESTSREEVRLTILHTNDTHSRIDPFPLDGGPNQGLGGVARRATLIERIRSRERNVLLLDSGDIFQGTPYFNFFHGEIEFRAMSAMRYDVATLGNHDFDNGVDGLVAMMPHAHFQFVSANYDAAGSPLEPYLRPWVIREAEGAKIGIFGVGIAFEGLVLEQLHRGVRYTDPYEAAAKSVRELRSQGCSLVICLSHLGYRYGGDRPSDTILAQRVQGIDLILGGHTHTFMDEPDVHRHPGGGWTVVNQVGWAGMRLGRIDVTLGRAESLLDAGVERPLAPRRWSWQILPVNATM